jgi:hypothetical protein
MAQKMAFSTLAARYVYIIPKVIIYMLFPKLDRRLFNISTEMTVHLIDGLSLN